MVQGDTKKGTFEMRSGSHVQLAPLRNRDLELQTTFGLLSLKRQVIIVQFLSINFFCWISSISVGFFKSSRFFMSPSICTNYLTRINNNNNNNNNIV